MSIEFHVSGGGGEFHYPDAEFNESQEWFDVTQEDFEDGRLSEKVYVQRLTQLTETIPEFIDAYSHLGHYYFQRHSFQEALAFYKKGIAIGESVIPDGFRGNIDWLPLDNRPYMRALHGATITYVAIQDHDEAVRWCERLLATDPHDNLGIRFLLGSEYLRVGRLQEAQKIIAKEAGHYPPYRYELALVMIMQEYWIEAATSIRKGAIENPYIAEMLCGNPDPRSHVRWHGGNYHMPEIARDYVEPYGDEWRSKPEYLDFLHWVYTHPLVVRERADIFLCEYGLAWEHEVDERHSIVDERDRLVSGVNDELSKAIVQKAVLPRDDRIVWPWEYWNWRSSRL